MMNVMMCWVECGDFIDAEKMEEWVPNKFQLMTLSRQQLHGIIQKYNLPATTYHLSNRERTASFIMGLLPDIKEKIRRKHFGNALPSLAVVDASEAPEDTEEEEEAVEGSADEPEGEVGAEEEASVAVSDDPDINDEDLVNEEQNVMRLEVAKLEDKSVVFSDDINIHQPLQVLKETALDLLGGTAESRDGMVLCSSYGIPLNESQTIGDAMRLVKSRRFFLKAVGLRGGVGGVKKAISKKSEKVNKDASLALKKKDFYELPLTKASMDCGAFAEEMEKMARAFLKDAEEDARMVSESILMKVSDETLDEMMQSVKSVSRASDKIAIIYPVLLEHMFPKMKAFAEAVEEAQSYGWSCIDIIFAKGFMAYDGSYNWQEFRQHVEVAKKVKSIASKKQGYMTD